MKLLLTNLTYICILLLIAGCLEDGNQSKDSEEQSLYWAGVHATAPLNPGENWSYFNYIDEVTYIFTGEVWDTMAVSGLDGVSIQWLGTKTEAPTNPNYNSAYYNSTDECSYIFNGVEWDTLAVNGNNGLSIEWQGELTDEPLNPQINWMYKNVSDGNCYIYTGSEWDIVSMDGIDGVSITWKGNLEFSPEDPKINWAYYNSTEQISYIFDGTAWSILSRDGVDGQDGNSINWLGTFDSVPDNPNYYDAYHHSGLGTSFIYYEDGWDILAKGGVDGKDGISIVWLGELSVYPKEPKENYAFYNKLEKVSFIFNGTTWDTLAIDGKDGIDGNTIIWKGSYYNHPSYPEINWCYYNKLDGITYIYSEFGWQVMCKNGEDGKDGDVGDTTSYITSGYIDHNDTLKLNLFKSYPDMLYLAQYTGSDSCIHSWEYRDPSWSSVFELASNSEYDNFEYLQSSHLLMENDTVIALYTQSYGTDSSVLVYSVLDESGISAPDTLATGIFRDIKPFKIHNSRFGVTYLNEAGNGMCTQKILGDTSLTFTIATDSIKEITGVRCGEDTLVFVYRDMKDHAYFHITAADTANGSDRFLSDLMISQIYLFEDENSVLATYTLNERSIITQKIHKNKTTSLRNVVGTSQYDTIGSKSLAKRPDGSFIISYDENSSYRSNQILLHLNSNGEKVAIIDTIRNTYSYKKEHILPQTDNSFIFFHNDNKAAVYNSDLTLRSDNQYYSYGYGKSVIKQYGDEFHLYHWSDGPDKAVVTLTEPKLLLRKLSTYSVGLINKTGQRILATLAIDRGRSPHPDAVKL